MAAEAESPTQNRGFSVVMVAVVVLALVVYSTTRAPSAKPWSTTRAPSAKPWRTTGDSFEVGTFLARFYGVYNVSEDGAWVMVGPPSDRPLEPDAPRFGGGGSQRAYILLPWSWLATKDHRDDCIKGVDGIRAFLPLQMQFGGFSLPPEYGPWVTAKWLAQPREAWPAFVVVTADGRGITSIRPR